MSVLRSVREHFVLPAPREGFAGDGEGPDAACADPAPRTPTAAGAQPATGGARTRRDPPDDVARLSPAIAALSAPGDAHALGAALGLALARLRGAPVVTVCVWSPGSGGAALWRAPALPAARRLAASLGTRGHDARPAGRLVVVRLPAAPADAALRARRVAAAAGAAPTVLALGGPRMPEFDALLAEQDLVVVAPPSGTAPVLARLALAGLECPHARTCVCELPAAQPVHSVAAAGLMLLPSMRRALAGAVEALP